MPKSRQDRKREKQAQQKVAASPGAPVPTPAPPTTKPAASAESPRFGLIRLHFEAPLHLSNPRPNDYGSSERVVHSDTFTAAIFQSWARLGLERYIPDGINADGPGFALSSLFPFFGGKLPDGTQTDPVYFWPKPFFRNAKTETMELVPGEAKRYKKVQYVDTAHLLAYLNQSAPPAGETLHGAFQSANLPKNFAEFLTDDVQTRLTKPRDESEPTPYYIERLYFRYDSGLWCLARYDNAEWEKRVKAAVDLLADEGIGTDRAVGNGQFRAKFEKLPNDFNFPRRGRYAMNLSLFCPKDHEQLQSLLLDGTDAGQPDPHVRYDLVKRGGWLSEPFNTYRKRSVHLFRPGSLFRLPLNQPLDVAGRLVDLKPTLPEGLPPVDHPVWRDGRALFLPVNL